KEADLLKDTKYVSGSRTLLRLHRGLEFVYEFLNSLADLCENDKTHGCCKTSYETTLAKHHPWVVRKGALVAMYALPTKGELLKRVCCNADRVTDFLPEMLKNTKVLEADLYSVPKRFSIVLLTEQLNSYFLQVFFILSQCYIFPMSVRKIERHGKKHSTKNRKEATNDSNCKQTTRA
ncbi:hypothetical protein DOY81_015224, partial [Sarcophaga bullata]